ncbi:hypothetical protein C723_1634 [Christiangramia flava JLT2011]|uniref:Uncharacterized protein n=1 Tax=Christiangramia flava JLT2011 TaxID=1229726 RepID=A0A1L7I9H0_9FLAO|nr:hypothetical protein GRFL_3522 [Christiangramia flava JLT2011]OSS39732.1 hypothetical protein C723_1634 [Christiangramia flava JLT2011]
MRPKYTRRMMRTVFNTPVNDAANIFKLFTKIKRSLQNRA